MIRLIKSSFYKEDATKKDLCSFIEKTAKFSFGDQCELFERKFASWQGRDYCLFVNSGSSANLAIIQALLNLGRLKKGDKVGFSAVTWSTNVMPLIELGLVPVPIDAELATLNVSGKKLKDTLKKVKIKLLFLTNLLGFCDDIDEIVKICKDSNIILIEDNCESLGSVYKGKKLGNFGLASTFSFYVGHHMSTIEGGAVCTDDEDILTMLQLVRAHGWDRNLSFSKQNEMRIKHKINSEFYSRYTFYDLGYNFRPTEINGFIGNVQLGYLNEIIEKRAENFTKMALPIYQRTDLYYPIQFDHLDVLSNFAVPIICKTEEIKNKIVEKCKDKIELRPLVGGDMVEQPFFKKYMKGNSASGNANAALIHKLGLYFGNNPELTIEEIDQIVKTFTEEI